MEINLKRRLEWLNSRIELNSIQKEYIELQMKELALEVSEKVQIEIDNSITDTSNIVYKLLHIPTGLFYSPIKGRWSNKKTHLSRTGKVYQYRRPSLPTGHVNISDSLIKQFPFLSIKNIYRDENIIEIIESEWEIKEYKLISL